MWLNYVFLVVYLLTMAAIAWYTRNKAKSLNDYLLAGRGMGGWISAFAYGTTYFSAVIFIGYAGGLGKAHGLSVIWIGIGNAIIGSLIPWFVLAKRTRRITHYMAAKTMPEFFEKRYESKYIKLIAAVLIFIFLLPYSASVYQGLGYLFKMVFNLPLYAVVLIMAGFTALYLFFGGYIAAVLSDFIQGIIMIVGVIVMVFFVFNDAAVGGIINGVRQLTANNLGIISNDMYSLIMLVLLTSLGTWGLPQIVHKFYAVRDEKAVKQAAWISTGFALIIGVGAYIVGAIARIVLQGEYAGMNTAEIIPNVLMKTLPNGLVGLIAVLVLSASMSTLSSLTLTSSSAVAVDIYKGFIKKKASEKNIKLLLRILCLVFIGISIIIAIFQPQAIINLMSLSWGTLAGCFLGPYIYGLYYKKTSKASVYASIIGGLTLTMILYIVSQSIGGKLASKWLAPPAIGVYTMLFSVIIVPLVSLFTKPVSNDTLMKIETALKSSVSEITRNQQQTEASAENTQESTDNSKLEGLENADGETVKPSGE